jgi:ribonuclease VapC
LIVDTSALVAVARKEPESEPLKRAMLLGGLVPAPVVFEYHRVMSRRGSQPSGPAEAFLQNLIAAELTIVSLDETDAGHAARANRDHGLGNGGGGRLNLVDLMVYAVARRLDQPILCTGTDFAATDAPIHPGSRGW